MKLAALVIAALLVAPATARPEGELRDQLEKRRVKLRAERWRLNVMNERARDVSTQLGKTQRELEQARGRLRETRTRLETARHRLELIQLNVKRTQARLRQAQVALEQRLRGIYQEGDINVLAVLLQAESFTDFLNQSEYLERIVDTDQQLIEEVRARKQELERQKAAAQTTVREIDRRKKAEEAEASRLAAIEARRAQLLARVKKERNLVASRVDELAHSTAELEAELQELVRSRQADPGWGPPPQPGTGQYILPAQGWITSPFGYRLHPIRGTTIFHAGLDIAADYGVAIKAADHGRVIYAGWYGGYGNAVIIDHGQGYSTLYGHCQTLAVYEGQTVTQGQLIARVGSTGMSTGPHLHWEVRYYGNPVDPRGKL